MEPLVSIVVPVYNVEKYLDKAIESICGQTYRNCEIILVDDGATDRSGFICDEYAQKDERITVFHKKNGGLSDARNAGLSIAKGDYIVFFDSDDWVEPNTIEENLRLMIEKKVPVIAWGYYADFVDEDKRLTNSVPYCCSDVLCQKNLNPEELIQEGRLGLLGYVWNKMYRTELLKEGQFIFTKGMSLVEDIVFNVPVLNAGEKIYFNSGKYTHYMQRGRATLGNRFYDNYLELKLLACDKRKELLTAYGLDKKICNDVLWEYYLYSHISTIRMINRKESISRKRKLKMVQSIVRRWKGSGYGRTMNPTNRKTLVIAWLFRLCLYDVILYVIK